MSEVECGWCGKTFTAIRETAECCSAKCRVYSHRGGQRPSVTPSVTPPNPELEPCVTASVTEPDPELDRLAKQIREGHEMAERAFDEDWRSGAALIRSQAKLISSQAKFIELLQAANAELQADNEALQACWDEAEAELAELKAEECSK